MFAVYAGSGDVPPLLGEYGVDAGRLSFRPKYPLAPGVRIRSVFRGTESFFEIPKPKLKSTTHVRQVFPTADSLPDNLLKLYIEFSASMTQGHAWKHIRLLKNNGVPVELPFLEIDQEMWDAEGKRLTVLFDPGRIKRGVKPLEDIGPAIEADHSYTLVIDGSWEDAGGAPLVATHRKEFRVTESDRIPIDPAQWSIGTVQPGTKEPLTIRFGEPLDAALALRLIRIEGARGTATLGPEEREWSFVPDQSWGDGPYSLKIDTALEDLAGNKVGRAFDVDVFDQVTRKVEREVLSLPVRTGRQ